VTGVIIGFTVIGSIILLGWLLSNTQLLPGGADQVLSRLSYFVFTPALLLTVLSQSDSKTLFSTLVPVSTLAAASCFLIAAVVARFVWRKGVAETTIVSISSGYVNANNIGLPVALYVLGNAALAAPIILINMVVFAPIALTLLDASTRKKTSWIKIAVQPLRNPIIIASTLGVLISFLDWDFPTVFLEPFRIVGGAAVPVMLIVLGMSLKGVRVWAPGVERREVALATFLKVAFMPAIAWILGAFVFGLSPEALFAVVVLAALPTAQGVFAWAHRFDRHVSVARDAVLISTMLSIPALTLIAAVLSPA
jgi:malonate transporter and related proteins